MRLIKLKSFVCSKSAANYKYSQETSCQISSGLESQEWSPQRIRGLYQGFLQDTLDFLKPQATRNEILQRRNQMGRCFLVLLKFHKGKNNKDDNDSRNNSERSLIIHYLPNCILSEHLISSFIPHNNLWLLSVITDCKSSTYHSTQKIVLKKKKKTSLKSQCSPSLFLLSK